jgi:hypothetical protein
VKALLIALAFSAFALADAPPATPPRKVVRVIGKCQGGDRPSVGCKTCKHCAYCGVDKGRGPNSATCAVCEKAKDAAFRSGK